MQQYYNRQHYQQAVNEYSYRYPTPFPQSDRKEALHRLTGKVKMAGLTPLP